jgi:hypothetical protein
MTISARPVRRSPAEWQAVISKHERSGLSRLAFCRREGIPPTSFDKWKRRLWARRPAAEFVDVTSPTIGPTGWEVEVTLPNGVVLRIRG